MRNHFKNIECYRVRHGKLATSKLDGANGAWHIPGPIVRAPLTGIELPRVNLAVISSDGGDWEHVSVSLRDRTPTWEEMCYVKDLFWEPEECVIQYHPPKSEYRNEHRYCLHMWKPMTLEIPTPPALFVAPGDESPEEIRRVIATVVSGRGGTSNA